MDTDLPKRMLNWSSTLSVRPLALMPPTRFTNPETVSLPVRRVYGERHDQMPFLIGPHGKSDNVDMLFVGRSVNCTLVALRIIGTMW